MFPTLQQPISHARLRREVQTICDFAGVPHPRIVILPELTQEHRLNPRRYAQVAPDGSIMEFAKQTLVLLPVHRLGLIGHEVGHILSPNTGEMGADIAALRHLGIHIGYDPRWPGKGLQVARSAPQQLVNTVFQ